MPKVMRSEDVRRLGRMLEDVDWARNRVRAAMNQGADRLSCTALRQDLYDKQQRFFDELKPYLGN